MQGLSTTTNKQPVKHRRGMRQALGFNFYDVFVVLFCVLFALLCVWPMWYVLVASVTPYEEFVKGGLMLWPTGGIDLQYYKAIFSTRSFVNSMWISVSKTVLATTLSVLVTASMAYGVSKTYIRGMKLINALVVFNHFPLAGGPGGHGFLHGDHRLSPGEKGFAGPQGFHLVFDDQYVFHRRPDSPVHAL